MTDSSLLKGLLMFLYRSKFIAIFFVLAIGAICWNKVFAQTCSGEITSNCSFSSNVPDTSTLGGLLGTIHWVSGDVSVNSGVTITAGNQWTAIIANPGSGIFTNRGTIIGPRALELSLTPNHMNSLINYGSMIGTGVAGILTFNVGGESIDAITNIGSIIGLNYGIANSSGSIATLNNLQGVGNANGALTYYGVLPTNYSIIINSPSQFGQLATTGSGSTTFGIYSGGVAGVAASVLSKGTYSSVLSGITSTNLTGATSGNYNGFTWVLNNSSGNIWDLVVTGASTADTQSSIQTSANALKGVYALQTASITNGLTYDCNVFDKEGICVSAGGRYDRVNTGNTHATNGLLIGSYKVDANTRVGAWVDQNLSASSATGVNLNNGNPMFGVFGVWNANQSGHGFEARLSAGYGDKDLTVTRQIVGTSEAGTGKTRLNTQGASAVVSYNFPVAADLTASPYLGVRYTRVNANAYTEASSTDVTAPLTYSALKQETTTALAGLKFSARMSPECGVFGSVGAELDTSNKGNNYSVTGVAGLTDIALNPDAKRLRGVASVGTYYDIDKTQRISLNAVYREEAFQRTNTLSTMATYTAGF